MGDFTKVKEIVSSAPVVVFSKTECGYCKRLKELLSQLGAEYKVVELDEQSDGGEIQTSLADCTGQKTVPNVFMGGKHIGSCDATFEMHKNGELVSLLIDVGAMKHES